MIDLCWKCVEALNDPRFPVRTDTGQAVGIMNTLTARNIMEGNTPPYQVGPTGELLPMIAVTTVNGSRVCGSHVAHITAEAIRARMRGR